MTHFIIDTVGEVTNPSGETFKGVILAVPHGTPDADAKEMLRRAASMWAGRVDLIGVDK